VRKGLDSYLEIAENTENFAKSYLIHFNLENMNNISK
jgi:hypothetical protein